MNVVLRVTGWDHAIAVFDDMLLPMWSNATSDNLFECTNNHCTYSFGIQMYCIFLVFYHRRDMYVMHVNLFLPGVSSQLICFPSAHCVMAQGTFH